VYVGSLASINSYRTLKVDLPPNLSCDPWLNLARHSPFSFFSNSSLAPRSVSQIPNLGKVSHFRESIGERKFKKRGGRGRWIDATQRSGTPSILHALPSLRSVLSGSRRIAPLKSRCPPVPHGPPFARLLTLARARARGSARSRTDGRKIRCRGCPGNRH